MHNTPLEQRIAELYAMSFDLDSLTTDEKIEFMQSVIEAHKELMIGLYSSLTKMSLEATLKVVSDFWLEQREELIHTTSGDENEF